MDMQSIAIVTPCCTCIVCVFGLYRLHTCWFYHPARTLCLEAMPVEPMTQQEFQDLYACSQREDAWQGAAYVFWNHIEKLEKQDAKDSEKLAGGDCSAESKSRSRPRSPKQKLNSSKGSSSKQDWYLLPIVLIWFLYNSGMVVP